MQTQSNPRGRQAHVRRERGVALILALLTLGLILLLGLALTMSSMSGIIVSGNYERDVRSFYLAEAGVNHAVSIFRMMEGDPNHDGTMEGDLNGDGRFDFDDVLAGSDPAQGQLLTNTNYIPAGYTAIPSSGVSVTGGTYYVRVYDDDNLVVNYAAPGLPPAEGNSGTADPLGDHNKRVVVRSVGIGANGARTVIDAVVGFTPYPALLTQGQLSLGGSSVVSGQYGSVHTNSNLSLGGSTSIAQSATASGTLTESGSDYVGGFKAGNQPTLFVPDIKPVPAAGDTLQPPNFFISKADLVLLKSADLAEAYALLGLGAPPSKPANWEGWIDRSDNSLHDGMPTGWTTTSGTWRLDETTATNNKTYFVYGDVKITGGTYNISIIATGHFDVSGNPVFNPYLTGARALDLTPLQPPFARIDLLFLAGTDFKMNGTSGCSLNGVIYAGEQVDLRGNANFEGQIVAKDRSATDSFVTSNAVSGNFTLNFNNSTGRLGNLTKIAWRQVKQF